MTSTVKVWNYESYQIVGWDITGQGDHDYAWVSHDEIGSYEVSALKNATHNITYALADDKHTYNLIISVTDKENADYSKTYIFQTKQRDGYAFYYASSSTSGGYIHNFNCQWVDARTLYFYDQQHNLLGIRNVAKESYARENPKGFTLDVIPEVPPGYIFRGFKSTRENYVMFPGRYYAYSNLPAYRTTELIAEVEKVVTELNKTSTERFADNSQGGGASYGQN